jgi:hypothetical protein
MMESESTYETSVNFYQTTRRYNPEDSYLHTRRCENLKSYFTKILFVFPVSCVPLTSKTETKYVGLNFICPAASIYVIHSCFVRRAVYENILINTEIVTEQKRAGCSDSFVSLWKVFY